MLKIIPQIDKGDCAIASLAMFLGRSYNVVLKYAKTLQKKNPAESGLWVAQIIRIAKHFGVSLKAYRTCDLEHELGLLSLDNYGKGWKTKRGAPEGHLVVLYKGWIFDPSGPSAWKAKEYIRCNKSRLKSLLLPRD